MRNKLRGVAGLAVFLACICPAHADNPPVKAEAAIQYSAPAAPATPAGPATVIVSGDQPAALPPNAPGQPIKPGEIPGGPGGPDKNKPGKPGEQPGKPGETKPGETKPGETKPDEPAKPLQHPTKPPNPPKPEELKARPGPDGKVSFNFNGQPWPAVLEWLAQISGMSLDWQEMPGDYLNLSTQRGYSVPEVRDLINQYLLARGFTLLTRGETLSVVNVKKLDLSLVPRVAPEELKDRQPYEFVKVSFALEKMTADSAVAELDQMKSPNGKLIPLRLTNRLEAVDAVVNLREIYALLNNSQTPGGQQRSVKEFILRFARAEEVRKQLDELLGKEKGPSMPQPGQGGQAMTPEMMQQLQHQQEMMARQGGNPQGGQPPGQQNKPPAAQAGMYFVVNPRKNSILAYAPPDKMALIVQVVETLDVPVGSPTSLLANVGRTQVYRLTGVEPDTLVNTLREIGNLDPSTNLQVDRKNKAIIVFGPLADHAIIGALVEKLSGSERQIAVRRLRRLAADYVAGTVEFMINGDKKDKSRSNSYWDRYSSSGGDSGQTNNAFRVDADVEHNQLILWANDVELAEVDNLLQKLGEVPAMDGPGTRRRIIETAGSEDAKALLERIQQAWGSVSPNPLEIKPSPPSAKSPQAAPISEPSAMRFEENIPPDEQQRAIVKFAQLGGDAAVERPRSAAANLPAKTPPVKVELTPDGRIAVTSDDLQALELFEDLAGQLAEAKKDYKVFHLKYCLAYGVALNLEEFFKNDLKKPGRALPFWIEMEYGVSSTGDDDKAGRLSKRRPLRFITDSDTNSILVQGADAKQLQTIEELIKLYDQPIPADAQSTRLTETIPLEYSKAEVIVETVKDVYRDLLSTNDKAFAGKNGERDANRGFSITFDSGDGKKEQKMPKFKGSLSIAADELSNTIVLSAPAYLFEQVKRMILDLDAAAAPASQMKVIKLGPGMRGPELRRQLLEALGQEPPKEVAADKKPSAPPNTPPKNNPNNHNHNAPRRP
ncbi:MAG: hypothetical protein IT426_05345 [Pirellulales bacterium]|nr:hypothetical protein [Pirellulales bacterium]